MIGFSANPLFVLVVLGFSPLCVGQEAKIETVKASFIGDAISESMSESFKSLGLSQKDADLVSSRFRQSERFRPLTRESLEASSVRFIVVDSGGIVIPSIKTKSFEGFVFERLIIPNEGTASRTLFIQYQIGTGELSTFHIEEEQKQSSD